MVRADCHRGIGPMQPAAPPASRASALRPIRPDPEGNDEIRLSPGSVLRYVTLRYVTLCYVASRARKRVASGGDKLDHGQSAVSFPASQDDSQDLNEITQLSRVARIGETFYIQLTSVIY